MLSSMSNACFKLFPDISLVTAGTTTTMWVWITVACAVALLVHWTIRWLLRRRSDQYVFGDIPSDTVCLFQVGRGPHTPSLSPFPLKLETFLRMAKIPYMNDHTGQFSRKGKTPWMAYNGRRVEDSQLCIEFLKKEFPDVDLDKGLTDQEGGVAMAFRALTEENLYWTMCHESFIRLPSSLDILLKGIFPWWKIILFKKGVGAQVRKQLWGQGIGRHSEDEIWDIAQRDLRALSSFLGSKPYLLGDHPREVDCAVFGMLSMVVWQMSQTKHERLVHAELDNLVRYCERMRDRFWPDWEHRCMGRNHENDHRKVYSF